MEWGSELSSKNDLEVEAVSKAMQQLQGREALSLGSPFTQSPLTVPLVEAVVAQAQGGPAALALEAAAVEEASLGTGSLQDVDAEAAEVAGVTAVPTGQWLWWGQGTLR